MLVETAVGRMLCAPQGKDDLHAANVLIRPGRFVVYKNQTVLSVTKNALRAVDVLIRRGRYLVVANKSVGVGGYMV